MDYLAKSIIATIVIALIAIIGYLYTPKSRSAFGYKTPMSLKNDMTWNYANNLSKKLFVGVVILFMVIEIVLYSYLSENQLAYKYSFFSLTILSLLIIPVVEIMLRLKFCKNGKIRK
ncbi:MAG TPA: SdpI family protein [Flavobacterium sp.]|nr:SdpI family protein [Flavobacterium sp.]